MARLKPVLILARDPGVKARPMGTNLADSLPAYSEDPKHTAHYLDSRAVSLSHAAPLNEQYQDDGS
jgi:hypothetical protein